MPAAKLPKPRFEIITARTIDPLVDLAVDRAAHTSPWSLLVPRSFIKRDLAARLLSRLGHGWIGPRIITTEELIKHYAEQLDGQFTLTSLQASEIIEGILLSMDPDHVESLWPGSQNENSPTARVIQFLARFCLDLDGTLITPEAIKALITADPSPASAKRKQLSLEVYIAYRSLLAATGLFPASQGQRLAADKARLTPGLDGVDKLFVVACDGTRPNDPLGRLLAALIKSQVGLTDIAVALVSADDAANSAWGSHGNDSLIKMLSGFKHTATDLGAARLTRPPALDALALDATAYRYEPTPSDRSVRVVRLPDSHLETKWVAQDIKRHLVEEGVSPSDIAVIGRSLGQQSTEITRVFHALGIPVVSSSESTLQEAPAVQAILALHRLATGDWSPESLLPVATSPYLKTNLAALLILRAGRVPPVPTSPDEWLERLVAIGAGTEPVYDALIKLANELKSEIPQIALPALRVSGLRATIERWHLEDAAYNAPPDLDERIVSGLKLTRSDLDALNALLRGTDEWLRGRELSGRLLEPLDNMAWFNVLERIASTAKLRLSTYGRESVSILDPRQAIGRTWAYVYVLGLTDGVWPQKPSEAWAAWSNQEKQELLLPNLLEEEAHERLLFHLTCAAATTSLVLSWSALDRFGSPAIPTSYLAGLNLRLAGLAPDILSPSAVLPVHESQVTDPSDEALVAALSVKNGILLPWMNSPAGKSVQDSWAKEHTRSQVRELGLLGLTDQSLGAWAGYIPEVMDQLLTPTTPYSPTELALYDQCHLKFYLTKLAHVAPVPTDVDPKEEAAFGSLQHAILQDLYSTMTQKGLFPSHSTAQLDQALLLVEPASLRVLSKFQGRIGSKLWRLDSAPLVDVIRKFVQRDLARQVQIAMGLQDGLSTQVVSLGERLGTASNPVAVNYHGEKWFLTGVIDRIEKIDDPRLAASPLLGRLQDLLMVYDYKTSRFWAKKPAVVLQNFLRAKNIQLPLSAYLASQHYGQRVFGFAELQTGQQADGPLMAVRHVARKGDGTLALEKLSDLPDIANPVDESISAALAKATSLVQGIRAGDFTPQPERNCWDCPFSGSCRASKNTGTGFARRPPLPLAVTMAEVARTQLLSHEKIDV